MHEIHTLTSYNVDLALTTASSWVEGGCPGCPGASTVISQPLDSKTLPWLAIPATQPWTPIQGQPGTHHTDYRGKREKKGGVLGGKQKNKKSTTAEKQPLKEKQRHTMLFPMWFQIAPTLRLLDLCEPVHICLRPLTAKQTAPLWTGCTGKAASLCC